MTSYTVRDSATRQPVSGHDTLDAAVDALHVERLAFLLNPPPTPGGLELVVTADGSPRQPGDVVVYFAASPGIGQQE